MEQVLDMSGEGSLHVENYCQDNPDVRKILVRTLTTTYCAFSYCSSSIPPIGYCMLQGTSTLEFDSGRLARSELRLAPPCLPEVLSRFWLVPY